MCRYAVSDYPTSYACLACRHVAQYPEGVLPRCPHCRRDLVDLGRDFKAPRKRDALGWAAVEAVVRSGRDYDSCGCGGPGYRPATKAAARRDALDRPWTPRGRR